jgi:hypothetical protein
MEIAMKFRAVDSFYTSATKQLRGGQEFEADDFDLSNDHLKKMVEKGLIVPVSEHGESTAGADGSAGANLGESGEGQALDMDKMTRGDLIDLAKAKAIDTSSAKTKADMIDLLRKAELAPKNKAEPGAPSNKQAV